LFESLDPLELINDTAVQTARYRLRGRSDALFAA
jgi:hypothetical protein